MHYAHAGLWLTRVSGACTAPNHACFSDFCDVVNFSRFFWPAFLKSPYFLTVAVPLYCFVVVVVVVVVLFCFSFVKICES